jgi:2,4-dienoyl-CoA reductase-like NADH-dependent reductase (Old Yellow Enzyme family)
MATGYESLFEPLTVGAVTLRNRVVLPPMVSNRDITARDGRDWYGDFAKGGAGLCIVEATWLDRFGPEPDSATPKPRLLFDTRLTPETLRPLVDLIHGHGAKAAIQLFMGPADGRDTPTKATDQDIEVALTGFQRATQICREAGFDGVEPHGAHGYLLNCFYSPLHNQRTDAYGGSLERRMKLGLEVVETVREAAGDEMLVLYRHTPIEQDGYTLEDSLAFAAKLVEAGVDVLDLSPSSRTNPADLAEPFKQLGTAAAVIGVGSLGEPDRAVEAIDSGRCDLVAVGRGLIADPAWPTKVQRGELKRIIDCYECNEGCFGNLRAGRPVVCVRNE